jgi:Ca-activated chloride channel homolog
MIHNKVNQLEFRIMNTQRNTKNRRGGILPLMAIMLPVTLTIVAFAINLAYLELNRTEMFVATDSASRAAGREFALTGSQTAAITAGKKAAAKNLVGGKVLSIDDSDFVFGEASRTDEKSRYNFKKGGDFPNAVEVTIRRTKASSNGALTMLFPFSPTGASIDVTRTSRANQVEADIALIIDRSGSMAYAENEKAVYPPFPKASPVGWNFGQAAPTPSRWRSVVDSVDVFLKELNNTPMKENVALLTYASDAVTDVGMTAEYSKVKTALDVYTKTFNSGATNISGGLDGGRKILTSVGARTFSAKIIVLLTDGIDTTGADLVKAAKTVADQKIMIFTVTYSDEADKATMLKVAKAAKGTHFHAKNAADLSAIFKDIARQIPVLITQ